MRITHMHKPGPTSSEQANEPERVSGRGRARRRLGRGAPQLPPPDPGTHVDLEPPAPLTRRGRDVASGQRNPGGPVVVAGVVGLVVATGSKFVDVLPSSSEVSVAAFGVALVVLGLLQHRRERAERASAVPAPADEVTEDLNLNQDAFQELFEDVGEPAALVEDVIPVDLPSLTGEIAAVLAQLRRMYGLAYRTTTWLDVVLPTVGFVTTQPELVRDLLAVSALDAGGIRADVAAVTAAHPLDAIVRAGSSLLFALEGVRDACEQRDSGIGELPQSDSSTWPSGMNRRTDVDVLEIATNQETRG